ncbi:MAG: hypothetical protein COC24_000670 [Alphaproteobacteria bacterium]|nr:hypothetical protein [Alphaproteobacteria bacterium]
MTDYIAAVDGGGTKSLGAIVNKAGHVQFMPIEQGCNPLDNTRWEENLLQTINHFKNLNIKITNITFGMPGYGEIVANDLAVQIAVKNSGLNVESQLINDVEMAFYGAFSGGEGLLLLSGTGSMGFARGPSGMVRGGGWGDIYGDEGSAFWIGRAALSMASKVLDGRHEDQEFVDAIFSQLQINLGVSPDPLDLLNWIVTKKHKRSAMASVARYVDVLANQGNATALQILNDAAWELTSLGKALAQRSGLSEPLRWAHAGSVFNSRILTQAVSKNLGNNPVMPKLSPIGGGLLLAAITAGWKCDNEFIQNIAEASK